MHGINSPEANDGEPEGTENVSVNETVPLCNIVLNGEDIMPAEGTEWLGCDELDEFLNILNNYEILNFGNPQNPPWSYH